MIIDQSAFNSPIGYAKRPYIPVLEQSNGSFHRAPSRTPDSITKTSMPKGSLEKLPFEIRARISNELSQFECLNLLLTSKTMYYSTVPRLYEYIIVDQQFSRFNNEKEYGYKQKIYDQTAPAACTYINSSFNFKRFLKSQISGTNSGAKYIKRFYCVDLPDSLNLFDHELNHQIVEFFSRVTHLHQLVWLSDNFRLEYLHLLPNKRLIDTLVLNIKFSNYSNELEPRLEDDCSGLTFPNLTNFQIQPFQNSTKLNKIINRFLINQCESGEALVCEKLHTLNLSRYSKSTSSSISQPNCQDLISVTDVHDPNSIECLFKSTNLRYLSNLTTLSLDDMLVSPQDSAIFMRSINLNNLETLVLNGISEYHVINSNTATASFLPSISPHLTSLKHLSLDFRQAIIDSVPSFLQKLPGERKLISLDLVIRNNPTKQFLDHGSSERTFYNEYGYSISLFHKTLQKLSIEVREEVHGYTDTNNINVLGSIPRNTIFYTQLQSLSNLRTLRLSPGENLQEVANLVGSLRKLQMLDIFGDKAGGAPNLGLGMIHPSVYDEWFKVQHVALLYLRFSRVLHYIRINKCVFECYELQVNPKYGISKWFESNVRVQPWIQHKTNC